MSRLEASSSVDPSSSHHSSSDFFEYCTIHGVKEVKRSSENSPTTMVFWSLVMMGCFAGVSYEIYQIVSYYQANPGVTQVSWTTQPTYKYPPMAFCPKTWLSWRRAKRFNLSENALAYVVSLVNSEVKVDEPFDEDTIKREVHEAMLTHGVSDFVELLTQISHEPTEILRVFSGPSNVSFTPILQSFGVCYLIEVEPIAATTLRTNVMLRLAYRPPKGDPRLHRFDGQWQPRLLLKDSNGLKANFISFGKKAIYIIDLEAQVHTRMSRQDKQCLLDSRIPINVMPTGRAEEYSAALCEFLCVEKERLKRTCDFCLNIALMAALRLDSKQQSIEPCFYYQEASKSASGEEELATATGRNGSSAAALTTPLWSPPDSEEEEAAARSSLDTVDSPECTPKEMRIVQAVCASRCPPPCKQWLFKYSTSILSEDLSTGEILLWIAYNPMDGIMLYEEVPTYTLDTFISNIGGQLGLWLGASIISILQICYYVVASLWKRRSCGRRRSSEDEVSTVTSSPQPLPSASLRPHDDDGTTDTNLTPIILTRL